MYKSFSVGFFKCNLRLDSLSISSSIMIMLTGFQLTIGMPQSVRQINIVRSAILHSSPVTCEYVNKSYCRDATRFIEYKSI